MVVLDCSMWKNRVEMQFFTRICLLIEILFLFLYGKQIDIKRKWEKRKAKERELESRNSN